MPDRITLTAIVLDAHANSPKQIVRTFARSLATLSGYDEPALAHRLENLPSNASAPIGNGVALYHGRMDQWPEAGTAYMRLKHPVLFPDAPDGVPVDSVFMLLSPERDGPVHLRKLARLTRLAADARTIDMLRGAENPDAVAAILSDHGHDNGRISMIARASKAA